ncbi:MAG TPA: YHS domain-containing protein [Dehalococcoidia bacterium]|nr:YHS domain-containing protein [Dehalococcoidia bacterium]
MAVEFFIVFKDYLIEVLPFLAIGFFISGLIYEFVPSGWVERHIGGRGIKPILYSTVAGTVLPICCIGSLPVAVSLHQKGARLGPVLAFLVATPATSISALIVCWALLGIKFTVFIFFAVILMGLVMGVIGNFLRYQPKNMACPHCEQEAEGAIDPICGMSVGKEGLKTDYQGKSYYFCCSHCQAAFEKEPAKYASAGEYVAGIKERMRSVFRYAFWDMVKEIGPELLLGLALAALVAAITPVGEFVGTHLGGGLGYPFSLVFGIAIYICSTASVPLVDALIAQGMGIGAGMVLLLVGPVTSWGALLVLRKEFGNRTLLVYLAVISVMALALGWCFSLI